MRVFNDVDFPLAPAILVISAFFADANGRSSTFFASSGEPGKLRADRPRLLVGGADG